MFFIRFEYDVGKNGDQCYKLLIVFIEGKDEMEFKEKFINGSFLYNGFYGEMQNVKLLVICLI